MAIQMHTFRRGAVYTWRKRLPAKLGGSVLQISLRTTNPLLGRRLATILGGESCAVIDAMMYDGLSKDDARRLLAAVIEREHRKLSAIRLAAAEDGCPGTFQHAQSADRVMGKALALLAERGASARHLTDADRDAIVKEGCSEADLATLQIILDQEAQAYADDPRQGLNSRSLRVMRDALGRQAFSNAELIHGRQIYYRGRSAAFQGGGTEPLAAEEARKLAAELVQREEPLSHNPAPLPLPPLPAISAPPIQPVIPAMVSPFENSMNDPAFMSLVERLMDQKRRQKMSGAMIKQMTRVFEQFSEATGIRDIREIYQQHVSRYVDMMDILPRHHGKSPKDKDRSLREILKNPLGQPVGLSVTTINRNLDYLGQLFEKGRKEGFRNLGELDVSGLRRRKLKRERDERPPFTADDVQAIIRHPIWHGYRSKGRWQVPGNVIVKDGLYWLPLIAALSGARRGEIAGLKATEIETVDGVICMRLQINVNRGLKNLSSARLLPLHPQLLELGIVEHAAGRIRKDGRSADLFPDMRPGILPGIYEATDDDEGGKFGDQINYRFNKIVDRQVAKNRAEKTFHSLRHYVATQLSRIPNVENKVRKDILGHVGESITDERYTETATLQEQFAAISHLPRLPL